MQLKKPTVTKVSWPGRPLPSDSTAVFSGVIYMSKTDNGLVFEVAPLENIRTSSSCGWLNAVVKLPPQAS
eukprot:3259068-Amphidinium_carterae.1